MTLQKFLTYRPLNINGQKLDSTNELQLNILEESGNYLLHKDLLRHFSSKNKVLVQQKPEVKFVVVVGNHGVKKVLGVLELVQIAHLCGKVVVLFSVQSQKKFF